MSIYSKCDFHIHTTFSPCAQREMNIDTILEVCASRGIKYLGITDHINVSTKTSILWKTREYLSKIEKPMQVLLGCEADIVRIGKHTVTDEMRAELDYIAMAANHFVNVSVEKPKSDNPKDIAEHYVSMFSYACTLDFVDTIVHPLYVMPGTHDPSILDLIREDDLADAIALAKENNIAMEISPRSLVPEQMEFRLRFLRLCKQIGVKFSIGTDAHRLSVVGNTQVLAPLIEEIGVTDDDIWLPKGVKIETGS